MRVAVETSALLASLLVVWLKDGAIIRPDMLLELQKLVSGRLFILIDDLVQHEATFGRLIEVLQAAKAPITVVACVRINELHIHGQAFHKQISKEFELQDLENKEVMQLLEKLSSAKILGPLQQYSEAGRQIS